MADVCVLLFLAMAKQFTNNFRRRQREARRKFNTSISFPFVVLHRLFSSSSSSSKKNKRERTNPPHVYTRHLGHKRERHTHHLRVYIGKRIRKEITQFNQSVTGFFFLFSGVYPAHLINVVTMNTAERHIAYIGCYDYATTTGNRKKKSTTNDLTSMPARVKVDQHSEITKNPPTILII